MEIMKHSFGWEIITNFALTYALLASAFLLPYAYIRALFNKTVFLIYLLVVIIYLIVWIFDKKEFFKIEFKN